MREHEWELEEVDGGHIGVCDFWRCRRCDAAGGPALQYEGGKPVKKNDWVFYADGSGLQLSTDCEESDRLILEHFKKTVAGLYAEGFGRELAIEFEVAVSTVKRWADGIVAPLPRMRKLVIQACREILAKGLR